MVGGLFEEFFNDVTVNGMNISVSPSMAELDVAVE